MSRSRSGKGSGESPRVSGEDVTRAERGPGLPGLLADDRDDDEGEELPANYRPSPEPIPEGERAFGRYTLLRRLAYGGMGEIFLARQGGAGSLSMVAKLVVIKRILSHMKRDDKHRRMFTDEARLQALFNNTHIVGIHDMGEESGHVYLAMEHVHGPSWRSLVDRCKKNREFIPLHHVCSMVAQAARGLSYAHNLVDVTGSKLNIVHRDINPHNVLVTYDGEVKIIDFGIAKSDLTSGHTETGTIKGKFSYMSPEQSAAQPLDRRSDIFTLGICLYELIALENPFRRGNVVLSLEAIQKETPTPLERKRREASPLQAVVDRCLAKDRGERFDDAEEVALSLESLLASDAIPPAPGALSAWLRERFQGEIAEHVQILEQTGSAGALVRRGADASSIPRARPSSSKSGEIVIAQPPQAIGLDAVPPPLDEAPLVGGGSELTSSTPAESFDVSSIADAVEPGPGGGWGRRAAFLAVFLLVGAGAAAALVGTGVVDDVVGRLSGGEDDPERVAVGEVKPSPSTPVEIIEPPPPSAADAPPSATVVVGEAPPTAGPPLVVDEGEAPAAKGTTKRPRPSPKPKAGPVETSEPKGKALLGQLALRTEGYGVKGSRKVYVGDSTLLVVDDPEAAFQVRLRVRADAAGAASFDVETEPWSVVRVDGVGRGKTPQRAVALPPGKRLDIDLANPKAGAMRLSLTLQPK